jgi:hypothetical protein
VLDSVNWSFFQLVLSNIWNFREIHITRDLPSTALSIYTNYFAEDEPYFCSLEEFKTYSDLHNDLMKYWHSTLPSFVHEVSYKQLIDDPKKSIQEILQYCDLIWCDDCLANDDTKMLVKTLSKVQVRKPINDSSLATWKNYKAQLGLFID